MPPFANITTYIQWTNFAFVLFPCISFFLTGRAGRRNVTVSTEATPHAVLVSMTFKEDQLINKVNAHKLKITVEPLDKNTRKSKLTYYVDMKSEFSKGKRGNMIFSKLDQGTIYKFTFRLADNKLSPAPR